MQRVLLMVLCLIGVLATPAQSIDHLTRLRTTCVSGDGRVIVTSGTLVPWLMREDLEEHKIAFQPQPHDIMSANAVAVSHDGSLIATAARSEIKIWDSQLKLKHTLPVHSLGLIFSPDGRWLVSKDFQKSVSDGFFQVIDTKSFKVVRTIRDGIGLTTDLIFTRDSQQIITGSGAGGMTVYLIDVATGVRRTILLNFFALNFAVSTNDQTIYVGGVVNYDGTDRKSTGKLVAISRQSGKVLKQFKWPSPISGLALLPKLGLLIGDQEGEVNIYDPTIGDATKRMPFPAGLPPVYGIYRSKDNFLIVQRGNGMVSEIFLGHELPG